MRRMLGALVVGLAAVAVVQAHDLFLIPKGDHVIVVFNHELVPDPAIKEATWKRFDGLKLTSRTNGKTTPLTLLKETDHLRAKVPAVDQVVVGVVTFAAPGKGDAKVQGRTVVIKAILGAIPADGGALGAECALEIVPKIEAGKVRFQVLAAGKPVSGTKVSVILPEKDETAAAATDETGWTSGFEAKGRYGVSVRREEAKTGEIGGVKFETMSHVATLVVDVK